MRRNLIVALHDECRDPHREGAPIARCLVT